jgi:alkaline phosphatase
MVIITINPRYPEILLNVKYSGEYIFRALQNINSTETKRAFIVDTVFPKWLNVQNFTKEDVEFLINEHIISSVESFIGHKISDLAGIGWATHGHSAVDVNLYAYGHSSEDLRGNHENTDIGAFIVRQLGLQLEPITARLSDCIISENTTGYSESLLRHFHN